MIDHGDVLLELDELRVDIPVAGDLLRVIHDVSLRVATGEAVGLVGESGSGKSMTAKAIMRLLMPQAKVGGTISFDGSSVFEMSRRELRRYHGEQVGMIYQDPRVHVNPLRTVGDFLREGLRAQGGRSKSEVDEVAVTLLREVGIADAPRRLRQYPHQLSGGLLQRVMIASALIPEPRLILADEPTTALDVTTQEEVMAILDEQHRDRGMAMILITHDLDLAAAVTSRIAVMYAGVIVETGPAGNLHDCALHPYTVGLLASLPSQTRKERLGTIPGRPVSAFEAGTGCVFSSRCPWAQERCQVERPATRKIGDQLVACHRAEELKGKLDYRKEAELG